MDREIRNILVLRNDRFGEFLLNIPALRALRETFVKARVIVVADPYVRELAEAVPFIDEIIEWGRQEHSLFQKLRLISLLKKKNIDMAIMLNPSKEFNILTYLAGIPVRVGYDRKWGFLLTHKIKDKKYLGEKHEIEYNLELVGIVGAKTEDKAMSLKIEEGTIKNPTEYFHLENSDNLVALNPWTSDPVKQWPKAHFSNLAKRLAEELKLKIVIIGGKEESREGEIFDNLGSGMVNMTGRTTLKELAALLKKCRLLVSGDSGPVHLACAVGTPAIAIFRSDIPGKCARRWGPSQKASIVIEKDNLSDISVDEVFKKVKEAISAK